MTRRLSRIDIFTLINLSLFLLVAYFAYYDRFVHYRGAANIHEFFFYAGVIITMILVVWRFSRHVWVPLHILFLIQAGILIHFAGAFVEYDGARLYDHIFLGIRFDKYVHFTNAVIATIVTLYVFKRREFPQTPLTLLVTMLVVMGLGAFVEIVEFLVVMTIPDNGVGLYVNNLSDMVANFVGTFLTVTLTGIYRQRYR
jgi:putative membrane protein